MILVSSHLDRVIQDFTIQYKDGQHVGLLDNFAGVLLTYLTLYDDHNLIELEKEGKIRFWHGKGEEWGRLEVPSKLPDIVIVVDVAAGKQYQGKDFSLENISGIADKDIKGIKNDLEWQGFDVLVKKYTGNPIDEDEAWQWRKLNVPVISFILPIEAKDDGWHRIAMDNTVSVEKILKARQGLKRLLVHLVG